MNTGTKLLFTISFLALFPLFVNAIERFSLKEADLSKDHVFEIVIKHKKNTLGTVVNYESNREISCSYNGGGGICKLHQLKKHKKGIRIIISSTYCAKYDQFSEGLSCQEEISGCYEAVIKPEDYIKIKTKKSMHLTLKAVKKPASYCRK